jgi:hypothetical protein
VAFQNIGHGLATDLMSKVAQSASNPAVTRTVQKLERGEFMRLLESSSGGDRRVSAGIECSRSLEILRIPVE